MERGKISACIIARDEEKNIEGCMRSVSWCNEIVVVDSGSTDRTTEIARSFGAVVYSHEWSGYREQKKFAFSKATCEWIFEIDADEICSDELRAEVERVLSGPTEHAGFVVLRRNYYLGRWLKNGGMYPDKILRIFRRDRFEMKGPIVHHFVSVNGSVVDLSGHIAHKSYPDYSSHLKKIATQVRSETTDYWTNGVLKFSFPRMILHPFYRFLKMYILKGGFKDGLEGFFAAAGFSFGTFARYAYLYELDAADRNVQRER